MGDAVRGRNGGRARCPYRAARVMRVGNGGGASWVARLPVGRKASDGAIAHGWRTHDMVGLKTPASRHEAWRARIGVRGILVEESGFGEQNRGENSVLRRFLFQTEISKRL